MGWPSSKVLFNRCYICSVRSRTDLKRFATLSTTYLDYNILYKVMVMVRVQSQVAIANVKIFTAICFWSYTIHHTIDLSCSMMEKTFLLKYWICGNDIRNTFSIKILRTKTIEALKQAIWDKSLSGSVMYLLMISNSTPSWSPVMVLKMSLGSWHCKASCTSTYEQNYSMLSPSLRSILSLLMDLVHAYYGILSCPSNDWFCFPGPYLTEPIVTVKLSLNCWVFGQHFNHVFSVKIPNICILYV